jgi:hypothetical protein
MAEHQTPDDRIADAELGVTDGAVCVRRDDRDGPGECARRT